MPEAFTLKTLSELIQKTLDLKDGDDLELQISKDDPNKILIVKHQGGQET